MPAAGWYRSLVVVLLVCAAALGNDACLRCHADAAELAKHQTKKGRPVEPLLVDGAKFARSVHASIDCADCHDGYDRHPHLREAETVGCAECHEEAADVFANSVHGKAGNGRGDLPVKCSSCHGAHDVMKPGDRESRLHPLNAIRTCSRCHGDAKDQISDRELLALPYTDDIHARGIVKRGLAVSASCVSCHGGHAIRAQGDPDSQVSRLNVQNTCGKCHVGIQEQYAGSVHFDKLQEEAHTGPSCSDCHPPHGLRRARKNFSVAPVATCGRCHAERLGTFEQTYHGKVSTLGFGEKVANCASCHGTHEIRAAADPSSRVHPGNLVQTCGECHENAHSSFVQYDVHADPTDAENYPALHLIESAMVWLLIGTFGFFGIHTLLWFVRSLAAGERPLRNTKIGYVRRWSKLYVTLHAFFMSAFLLLALTGLPLHFSDRAWATSIMEFFGGIVVAGTIHRLAAFTLFVCSIVYLIYIVKLILASGLKELLTGPSTMLPRWKDFQDFFQNLGWFLFLRPKPRFDRWTYWEKFHFWAIVWGMMVIGASGILLWFPETMTRIVPGWMLNFAVVVHGHEALIAVGFSFTVHMYQSNLRPERFPLETYVFTGSITEETFKAERPLEYERLVSSGAYEERKEEPPDRRTIWRARLLGALVMIVGIALTLLILFIRE